MFGVEIWAAIRTGSLALLSDAFHLLMDISGLVLAYVALRIASRPADPQASFGYQRAEVLAAAFNGLLLIGIAGYVVYRAIDRLGSPLADLDHALVLWVAVIGLLANLLAAWLLRHDAAENINTKGAFLNVLGDALASIGVIVAALLVRWTGDVDWDTYVSFLVAVIIAVSAWGLLRGAISILLEVAPPHLDLADVKRAVEGLEGAVNVHDLHVWTLTPGHHSLSMHVSIRRSWEPRFHEVTEAIEHLLMDRFGLEHCTIQVEPEGHDEVSDRFDPVKGELPDSAEPTR